MNAYETDTHDRLGYINTSLEEIDNNLDKYFSNYNLAQLSRMLKEKDTSIDDNSEDNNFEPKKNLKKQDINEVVEICNQLWVINGLINEYHHLTTFQTKIQAYGKLNTKFIDLKKTYTGLLDISSIGIFENLNEKINFFKSELIDISEKKFQEFLTVNDDLSIKFSNTIDDFTFTSFLKACRNLYNEEINILFNLNRIFGVWLNGVYTMLNSKYSVIFDSANSQLNISTTNHPQSEFLEFVKSMEQIILFFNDFTNKISEIKDFNNLRIVLGKSILKELKSRIFLKKNVYPLIVDKLNYDENKNNETSNISTVAALYKISALLSGQGWSKDGICELEFWIDDLTSSWVDNLVSYTIDDLKEFAAKLLNGDYEDDLRMQNLILVELDVENLNKKDIRPLKEMKTKTSENKDQWNDDWDTNDNDGWNDESAVTQEGKEEQVIVEDDGGWGDEDLDLDDESVSGMNKNADVIDEVDDGWDAWDKDINIENEEEDETINESPQFVEPSFERRPSYRYSSIVKKLINILDNYMKNYDDLKALNVNVSQMEEAKQLFKHGFKKLCISYFMVIEHEVSETYGNNILFYNDFNKLLEECHKKYDVDLTTCYKMNFSSLNESMNYNNKLNIIINDYNKNIWSEDNFENDDKLEKFGKEFLIRFETQFDQIHSKLSKLSELNTQLVDNTLLTIIFRSFNTICDKILSRTNISSYGSAVLSDIIDHIILHITKSTRTMNIKLEKIQTFDKLQQIRLILCSNLKEILNLFYDAKLYELETHELVSLIQSLFVESPQRVDAINEIRTVRETRF
jgi:hypothetical protein